MTADGPPSAPTSGQPTAPNGAQPTAPNGAQPTPPNGAQRPGLRTALALAVESRLRLIEPPTAVAFRLHRLLLAQDVDLRLAREPTYAPRATQAAPNHWKVFQRMHGEFMAVVLELRSDQCLIESVIWGYRYLLARHADLRIVPMILDAWRQAIRCRLGARQDIRHLDGLYETLQLGHSVLVAIAETPEPEVIVQTPFQAPLDDLVTALLDADERRAESVVMDHVKAAAEVPVWWEEVVTPALRKIGRLWALAEIDEAQEHIATAIAFRVMAGAFPRFPRPRSRDRTIAVVVPPGEVHDIGASMVRDTLQLAGYSVLFTGQNTPTETVVPLIAHNDVSCLLVSTTVALNLPQTSTLIRTIRGQGRELPVVVGGQAYTWDQRLWQTVGADAHEISLRGVLGRIEDLPET